jgi:hypothetical protein
LKQLRAAGAIGRWSRPRAPTNVQWIDVRDFDEINIDMTTTDGLARETIDAHGGLERWRQFAYVSARLRAGGLLWTLKHQQGVLDDATVRVALDRQWASHTPFPTADLRTSFEPHRVAIETVDGRVVDERTHPRDSFAGHTLDTPWDRLQLAYFAGYAMWTYLTIPFLLAMDGVAAEEIEPRRENGERWRGLRVTLPDRIASHTRVQTFYFGSDGLLRRHDYDADVLGGSPVAHYVHGYRDFSGIAVPTRRFVFPRTPEGSALSAPLVVSIDLSEIEFERK